MTKEARNVSGVEASACSDNSMPGLRPGGRGWGGETAFVKQLCSYLMRGCLQGEDLSILIFRACLCRITSKEMHQMFFMLKELPIKD